MRTNRMRKAKKQFDELEYERLLESIFQAMGNLSRYARDCGLTKDSIIQYCEDSEGYSTCLLNLMELCDKRNEQVMEKRCSK